MILLLIIAGIASGCFSQKNNDTASNTGHAEAPFITITGNVSTIGNDPFTEAVIRDTSDPNNVWHIRENEHYKIESLEGERIRMKAKVVSEPVYRASGKFLYNKQILYEITITKIE